MGKGYPFGAPEAPCGKLHYGPVAARPPGSPTYVSPASILCRMVYVITYRRDAGTMSPSENPSFFRCFPECRRPPTIGRSKFIMIYLYRLHTLVMPPPCRLRDHLACLASPAISPPTVGTLQSNHLLWREANAIGSVRTRFHTEHSADRVNASDKQLI